MRGRRLLLTTLGSLLLAPAVPAATPDGGEAAGATTAIRVTMTEFKFVLSRKTAPVGVVWFRVVNKGETGHDFKIKGKKTPIYDSGKAGTLKVTFTKRGKFSYLCTVPAHAASGMKGVLTIR